MQTVKTFNKVLVFPLLLILAILAFGVSEEDIGVKFKSERGGKLMTAGERRILWEVADSSF